MEAYSVYSVYSVSMPWTEQPIFFLDFEGSRASGILEFGVAEVLGDQIVSARTRLCRATGRVRDEDVAIHGLREAALAAHAPFADDWEYFAGLRERGFGVFEGKTFAELEATWPEQARRWRQRDPQWAPEGGESLTELRERITRTASELAAQHLGQQIVLVAHGGVMDVLYRAATGQELQAPRTWDLGNAAINRLLWTPNGFTLVGWSDTRHLEDDALDEMSA